MQTHCTANELFPFLFCDATVNIMSSTWPDFEGRCAPPPPLQSDAPPLGKVSMIDQSENLTFFGSLGSTLRKNVANSSLYQVPYNAMF